MAKQNDPAEKLADELLEKFFITPKTVALPVKYQDKGKKRLLCNAIRRHFPDPPRWTAEQIADIKRRGKELCKQLADECPLCPIQHPGCPLTKKPPKRRGKRRAKRVQP